jgi:hypothetical protein
MYSRSNTRAPINRYRRWWSDAGPKLDKARELGVSVIGEAELEGLVSD